MLITFWQKIGSSRDWLGAAIILGFFLLAMVLVRLFWLRILRPLARRTQTELDDLILQSTRGLVFWGLLLLGIYASVTSLGEAHISPALAGRLAQGLGVIAVALVVWTGLKLATRLIAWYANRVTQLSDGARDITHQVGFLRKAINFLLLVLGLYYVLRILKIDISPLLAGGAIGGLAIALALQDTLSNLFAGFSLNIDKPISVGDFIKLESGEEGFVEEIGWRNTKVRLWANNLVILPNSKLSQSIITNYFLPQQEMSVYVSCGVSYDSDLQRVEDVTVEVAKQVMREVEGSSLDWEPVVRWKEFGDFAITFMVVLRVKDFGVQYLLSSEFIKALHRRFRQEGIEIPFPIRTLIMKS